MKVLVIGSGGREHAIVWKLRQNLPSENVYCAPGNGGIGRDATIVPIAVSHIGELLRFARNEGIDLTVVGPEQPLVDGIVDEFERNGMKIFGPSKSAARLEGSKAFAKRFMEKYGIPTATFRVFSSREKEAAKKYVRSSNKSFVVKADGLAAGKGVVVCGSPGEAEEAIDALTSSEDFGVSGERIVIEECLRGEEVSVFVLTDGDRYALLPPAQDHKRASDGDTGKNTGGMGAYAPAPVLTGELATRVEQDIVLPVLGGMREEGTPYRGCLYIGIMLTQEGPKVLEFNCRFGDPEAQVVIPLIEGDFGSLLLSIAGRTFDPARLRLREASCVCVVLASGGYPGPYTTGKTILGLGKFVPDDESVIFHAGTKRVGDGYQTAGGRVLGVTAIGGEGELGTTIRRAYEAVSKISFDGMHYRTDIGKKALHPLRVA